MMYSTTLYVKLYNSEYEGKRGEPPVVVVNHDDVFLLDGHGCGGHSGNLFREGSAAYFIV